MLERSFREAAATAASFGPRAVLALLFAVAAACGAGRPALERSDRPATGAATSAATGAAAPNDLPPLDPGDALATGRRVVGGLLDGAPRIPAEWTDPGALSREMAGRPDAAFVLVHDGTAWEPYRGTMRGEVGTLLARGGSSLDRALLLARLVAATPGTEVRIARARLDPAAARSIVAGALAARASAAVESPAGLADVVARAVGDALDRAAAATGASPEAIDERMARQAQDEFDLEAGVVARADRAIAALRGALDDAGVARRADLSRLDATLLEAARDHFWVRVRGAAVQQALGVAPAADGFVDLDPATPGARPGRAPATAASSFPPDAVPEDLVHRLTVVVRADRRVEGGGGGGFGGFFGAASGPTTEGVELLRVRLDLAEAAERELLLWIGPATGAFAEVAAAERPDEGALGRAIAEADRFEVVMRVGDETRPGATFDPTGAIADTGDATGGFGAAVGGLLGGGGGSRTGTLVDLVLEYTTSGPDGERTEARSLLGAAGAGESGFHGVHAVELHLAAYDPTLAAEVRRRVAWLERLRGTLDGATGGPECPDSAACAAADLHGLAGVLPHEGAALRRLRAVRDSLLASGWPAGLEAFRAGAFLGGAEAHVEPDAAGAGIAVRVGYDLIATERLLVAAPADGVDADARAGDLFDTALRQTVLENALEHEIAVASSGGQPAESASAALDEALVRGVPLVVVRGPGDAGALAGLPERARALVLEDVRRFGAVVVPASPVRIGGRDGVGWFAVDPATGAGLGRLDTGRGQAAVEYGTLITRINIGWTVLMSLLQCPWATREEGGVLGCFAVAACNALVNWAGGRLSPFGNRLQGPARTARLEAYELWYLARRYRNAGWAREAVERLGFAERALRQLAGREWGDVGLGLALTGFAPLGTGLGATGWPGGDGGVAQVAGWLAGDGIVGTLLCDLLVGGIFRSAGGGTVLPR